MNRRLNCLRALRAPVACAAVSILAMLMLASAAPSSDAAQVLGARYPALSPDGHTVAFEYWGDIWTAPVDGSASAQRLTDHVAWDYLPRFSPDGSQIAFVSRRSGNDDIWVMPSGGGVARQVTTHSGADVLDNWLPDGSGVVFHSNRGLWSSDIYTVAVPREGRADQGVEQQLTAADHYNCAFAAPLPDGSFVVQRGVGRWWRKRYRGSANNQLWRLAKAAPDRYGEMSRITDFNGRNDWPMAGSSGAIYYVSDPDGIDNIYAMQLSSDAQLRVTSHATDGVQWPSIQPGGDRIVYDFNGGLWTVDFLHDTSPHQIPLRLEGETKDNAIQRVSWADQAGEVTVSPDGKYVVAIYGGDLWAVRDPETYGKDAPPDQDLGRAIRLTATDGVRERNPVFASDSRHLAYSADDGQGGQYTLRVMDLQQMASGNMGYGDGDHLQAEFDPTNPNVVFCYTGNNELRRINLKQHTSNVVATGNLRDAFSYNGYDVSPDGKWVAYVNSEPDWSSEIYIAPADGSQPAVNITKDPGADNSPQWSRDGSRLVWRSDREDQKTAFFAVELNPLQLPVTADFFLKDEPADQSPQKKGGKASNAAADDSAQKDSATDSEKKDGQDKDRDKDKQPKKPVLVKVNFKDIAYRARRVTRQEGIGSGVVSLDGKWLIYEANPDGLGSKVFSVRIDPRPQGAKSEGWEPTKQLDGGWSQPQLTADGKRIYYRESAAGGGRRGGGPPMGGAVKYAKFDSGKVAGTEAIAIHADYTFDQQERWREMFREGWHVLGQRFYDPNMHGVDWPGVYAKYAPYMDHIRTPEEFEFVFSELMGELNASHLGITMASSSYSSGGPTTGHLGLEFADGTMSLPWNSKGPAPAPARAGPGEDGRALGPAPSKGLTVTHITYLGPADQKGVDIKPGDVVLSFDGAAVSPQMRWYDLLQDKAGQPVKLRVSRGGKEHDTTVKATSWLTYQGLLYREWEKLNEDAVAKTSGGKLGYIHIAGMDSTELAKFKREFFSEVFDKTGLVVDVRFNPGGFIHEDLFDLLDRQPFGWNVPRDEPWTVQPPHAFLKPKALLINARSGSDAEIFPAGWREQHMGPIVGVPTYGAVIGTSGFTLVDGTWVRLPLEGWYELSGRNLEAEGTPPDVLLDIDPNALRHGDDAQLAKAVELVLAEAAHNPPPPTAPQPYPQVR